MPAPHERRYYTATPDGQTYGPYPAAQMAQMLASGNISHNTPVIAEGDQQWTTLAAIAPYLGIALLPPPPRPGPPPVPPQQAAWGSPPRQPQRSGGTKGLRLGMLLGAMALFFLPWLEFRCSGQSLVEQSGFEAAMGTVSAGAGLKEMAKMSGQDPDKEMKQENGNRSHAWLIMGAAGAVVLALLTGLAGSAAGSGILALAAAGLIGAQMVTGFPIEKAAKEKWGESGVGGKGSPFDSPGLTPPKFPEQPGNSPLDAESQALQKQMEMLTTPQFSVAFLPCLWGELALLVICGLMSLMPQKR